MATKFFPAAIIEDDDAFHVRFLDLPQAFTQGETFEHALQMANEVLDIVLDEMTARGEQIPTPTVYGEVADKAREVLDREQLPHVTSYQLVAGAVPGKSQRVMISLDEELLKRVDEAAGHYGRSTFLAEAARAKLAGGHAPLPVRMARANAPIDKKHRPASRREKAVS